MQYACVECLHGKRDKAATHQKGALISGGEITHQELDAMPLVCFDRGFSNLTLSDHLRGQEKCILFLQFASGWRRRQWARLFGNPFGCFRSLKPFIFSASFYSWARLRFWTCASWD